MVWFKRAIVVFISLVLICGLGFKVFKKSIANAIFERAIEQNVGIDPTNSFEDGLHIYLCGTGSPMPDASRAGPCLAVLAGERGYVFDVGSGGVRNLGSMRFPIDKLEAVYLTHLHSDHIDGLGELLVLSWVGGQRTSPTPVIGPTGTDEVVKGFNRAYRIDSGYRVAHHGAETVNVGGFGGRAEEITVPTGFNGQATIFQDNALKITAITVNHAPIEPAFAYRIDYKDRSVVISGDTVYHPGLVTAAKDADLLLHEALNREMVAKMGAKFEEREQPHMAKIFKDIEDYHTSPEEAAKVAANANVDHLVLYHIVPVLPAELLESVFLGDAKSEYSGPITVGQDGMIFTLPTGSDRIIKN